MAQSLEDIDREFEIKLAAQEDPEKKRDLELEKEQTIGRFLREEIQRKDRDLWVKSALAKFPDAVTSEIVGDNEQAVEAAAKGSHEKFNAKLAEREVQIKERLEKEMGQRAWGGQTGGAGTAANSGPDPKQETEQIYQALREGKLTPYQEKRLRELRLGPMFDRMAKNLVESA